MLFTPPHTDGLPRTFPGTGIVLSRLASHRQTSPVPDSPVAANLDQPLDIHGHFTAEIALYFIIFIDAVPQAIDFIFSQVTYPGIGVNSGS